MTKSFARARKVFTVMYWWHGEAHRVLAQFRTKKAAVKVAYELVGAGYPARVTRVR